MQLALADSVYVGKKERSIKTKTMETCWQS